jgi:hypothetical protein
MRNCVHVCVTRVVLLLPGASRRLGPAAVGTRRDINADLAASAVRKERRAERCVHLWCGASCPFLFPAPLVSTVVALFAACAATHSVLVWALVFLVQRGSGSSGSIIGRQHFSLSRVVACVAVDAAVHCFLLFQGGMSASRSGAPTSSSSSFEAAAATTSSGLVRKAIATFEAKRGTAPSQSRGSATAAAAAPAAAPSRRFAPCLLLYCHRSEV